MRVTVNILKTELDSKMLFLEQILEVCDDLSEVDNVYILSPRSGKLFELLDILKERDVNFETRFNLADDLRNSHE
jgi:hypothetical protein